MNCLSGATERKYTPLENRIEEAFAPFTHMNFMEASARAGELVVALTAEGHDTARLREIANAAVNQTLEVRLSEQVWQPAAAATEAAVEAAAADAQAIYGETRELAAA